jgi:hypothetical protein
MNLSTADLNFMSLSFIYLEVININVRNFNFPIGFYSKPHSLWTPQNMTLSPFTTKLKTSGLIPAANCT